jgi:uncharacterized membrane protein YraQ (UPF0718 family)|tara:strand:+ start:1007 stop:1510 length:504 start_codon:yes stop_codon:yes gene_type:complete
MQNKQAKPSLTAKLKNKMGHAREAWKNFRLHDHELAGGILGVLIIGAAILAMAGAMVPLYGIVPVLYAAILSAGFAGLVIPLAHQTDSKDKKDEVKWTNSSGQEVRSSTYAKLRLADAEKKITALGNSRKSPQKISAAFNEIVETYDSFAKTAKVTGGRYRFPAPRR